VKRPPHIFTRFNPFSRSNLDRSMIQSSQKMEKMNAGNQTHPGFSKKPESKVSSIEKQ
jgi:hypothetical protein